MKNMQAIKIKASFNTGVLGTRGAIVAIALPCWELSTVTFRFPPEIVSPPTGRGSELSTTACFLTGAVSTERALVAIRPTSTLTNGLSGSNPNALVT